MRQTLLLILGLLTLGAAIVGAQETPTATPEPEAIPTIVPVEDTVVLDSPLLGLPLEPPMTITLPDGWDRLILDTYAYKDIIVDQEGQLETVQIAVYQGPVTDGNGWIVALWGFDSVMNTNILPEEYAERGPWLDGQRLLQFVVFDIRCNIGTAPARDYEVGGEPAIGTTFNVVDCPFDLPDTRGWFASLNVDGLNFAFYAYVDPLPAAGSPAEFELQAILDSIDFTVDEITVTAEELEATRQAIEASLPEITPEATAPASDD